jgi:sulfur carrier protein
MRMMVKPHPMPVRFFFARSWAMRVILNGEEQEIRDDITVAELLHDLQIILQYGAVAVNRRVVRKRDHEATYLRAGDRIEIVRPVGGG